MTRGTVFLVDDDASVRKALRRLIRSAGFDVEAFEDAAGYLAAPPPSERACMVLDVRMPAMTGFELHAAIAGTPRALPTVFITGHGDERIRGQALAAGAVDLLFKPIDEEELVSAIERALKPRH
jgi:FixJ family two-component response regulator